MFAHLFELSCVIFGLICKVSYGEDCWGSLHDVGIEIAKMCYYDVLDDDPDCDGYASCAHATYINQTNGDNNVSLDCEGLFIYYILLSFIIIKFLQFLQLNRNFV